MRARPVLTAMLCGVLVASGGCGVTGNLRLDPGFAPLGSPGRADTDRQLGLSLGPLPIRLARAVMADDPEMTGLLEGLKGVRVYVYDVDGDAERVRGRMEAAQARLVERGWEPIVAVREDGGLASGLVRIDDRRPDVMRGLVVMVHDDEEVVLVNLIGRLQPETFALAMDELGIELPTTLLSLP